MPELFTIGHADRPRDAFATMLHHHGITLLVDIRRFPGSRHAPQFNQDVMRIALATAGIGYLHLPVLGGRRRPLPDSRNTTWRNASFQGYADYMETSEFSAGLAELKALAAEPGQRVAIMCAETVWWRCHRALVSDALLSQGWQVWHILDDGAAKPHRLSAPARIVNGTLTYHPDPDAADESVVVLPKPPTA